MKYLSMENYAAIEFLKHFHLFCLVAFWRYVEPSWHPKIFFAYREDFRSVEVWRDVG